MKTSTATAIGVASALTGLAAGYRLFARDTCVSWGSTAEEVERVMPGDDLLAEAGTVTTRSITVAATPEQIWPWLVQMGPGRGGAYTYDWIENLLGLNMHSADEILPQFQQLAVDDVLPMGESGPAMRVAVLDRPRAFVLASTDGHWVWAFGLYPTDEGTRLVSRNRIALSDAGLLQRLFFMLIMEPGSLIMEAKMLHGIKERAERTGPLPAPVTNVPTAQAESPYVPHWPTRTLGS
ncbi:SRPBCC family protein [Nocardia aurantiaca]|uniref:SRPBCC family protein n=1 Tax=Nocardia aurantiaca TaxID=2675850 RepID=A0A6I3L344_9NOCA|nr:SRPBCC family protein [Nocardia aurantiaca]MTE14289.1 SRPBCC family protein [Nocardia aurantiaca]